MKGGGVGGGGWQHVVTLASRRHWRVEWLTESLDNVMGLTHGHFIQQTIHWPHHARSPRLYTIFSTLVHEQGNIRSVYMHHSFCQGGRMSGGNSCMCNCRERKCVGTRCAQYITTMHGETPGGAIWHFSNTPYPRLWLFHYAAFTWSQADSRWWETPCEKKQTVHRMEGQQNITCMTMCCYNDVMFWNYVWKM